MGRLRTYGFYVLAWTAAGLFYFTQQLARRVYWNDVTRWSDDLVSWMVGMYIYAAFTPAILWLGERWPIERSNWKSRASLHLLFSSVISVLGIAIETPILLKLQVAGELNHLPALTVFERMVIYTFHGNVLRHWIVLSIQVAARYHRKYQEREKAALRLELKTSELAAQLAGAQLSALKMQLQPHFLFNTLGAIMVLVRQQRGLRAEEMITRLSDLLRRVLEDVDVQEVPLRRELEFLRLYLSIEQVRFEDRLSVSIAADPDLAEALVPHMALQPLVENAVRHALAESEAGVRIEVDTRSDAGKLVLTVSDNGPGLPAKGVNGCGIGLSNTRARLRSLYGEDASLRVEDRPHGGVVATIQLPLVLAGQEESCASRY